MITEVSIVRSHKEACLFPSSTVSSLFFPVNTYKGGCHEILYRSPVHCTLVSTNHNVLMVPIEAQAPLTGLYTHLCVWALVPMPGTVCGPWSPCQALCVSPGPHARHCVWALVPMPGTVCEPWSPCQALCVGPGPHARHCV